MLIPNRIQILLTLESITLIFQPYGSSETFIYTFFSCRMSVQKQFSNSKNPDENKEGSGKKIWFGI